MRLKLMLHVQPADKTAIRCVVGSGSHKTSESQATEIVDENTADCIGLLHHKFIPPRQMVTSTIYLAVMKCPMRRISWIQPEYCKPGSCWGTPKVPRRGFSCMTMHRHTPQLFGTLLCWKSNYYLIRWLYGIEWMNFPLVFQLVGCVSPLYPIICQSFHF